MVAAGMHTLSAQGQEQYVVVHKSVVVVREGPGLDFTPTSHRRTGEIVQLGEYDATGNWRQCLRAADSRSVGWMMLHHPALGPLLKPVAPQASSSWSVTFPGETALGVAVREKRIWEARRLIEARADPNEPDCLGETPLFEAACKGHTEMVAMLLDARADPALRSVSGGTAMDFANGPEAAALMAAMNPEKAKEADKVASEKALRRLRRQSLATRCMGRMEEISMEAREDEEVDERCHMEAMPGETPLAAAVRGRHAPEVRRLLESRASPHEPDSLGETPLFEAASHGSTLLVALLLDARADAAHRSHSGLTALDVAKGPDAAAIVAAMNSSTAVEADRVTANRALRGLRRQSLMSRCTDRVDEVAKEVFGDATSCCDEGFAAAMPMSSDKTVDLADVDTAHEPLATMTPPTTPREQKAPAAMTPPTTPREKKAPAAMTTPTTPSEKKGAGAFSHAVDTATRARSVLTSGGC